MAVACATAERKMHLMRLWIAALAGSTLSLGVYGCGSGRAGAPSNGPSSPAGPTPPMNSVFSIDIAEINGPNSFYPSPTTISADQNVVWWNSDVVTHHVVFDDDSIDT